MPIGEVVYVQDVPAAIQAYINAHFPSQSIAAIYYNEHPPRPANHRPNGNGWGNKGFHANNENEDDHYTNQYSNDDDDDDGDDNDHTNGGSCGNDGTSGAPTPNNDGGIYQVILADGTVLFFDENGNLVYTEGQGGEWWEQDHDHDEIPIAPNELPDTIVNYIATNYPDHFIIKAEIEPDGSYEICLNGGIKLYFDENGIVLGLENEFALRISSINFPDTVAMGQTVAVSGYIVNEGIYPFTGNTLSVVYAIEDETPSSFLSLDPDAQAFDSDLEIAPGDSIPFNFDVDIEATAFAIGYDIAIIWPDVPTVAYPVFTNNPAMSQEIVVLP